jgi:hypothetical protein
MIVTGIGNLEDRVSVQFRYGLRQVGVVTSESNGLCHFDRRLGIFVNSGKANLRQDFPFDKGLKKLPAGEIEYAGPKPLARSCVSTALMDNSASQDLPPSDKKRFYIWMLKDKL